MATRKQSEKKYRLDSEPYVSKVREARKLAHEALKHHGEPTMSLEELREMVDRELGDFSLGDYIVEQR